MEKERQERERERWSVPQGGMQNVHVLLVLFDKMTKHTHTLIHFYAHTHKNKLHKLSYQCM